MTTDTQPTAKMSDETMKAIWATAYAMVECLPNDCKSPGGVDFGSREPGVPIQPWTLHVRNFSDDAAKLAAVQIRRWIVEAIVHHIAAVSTERDEAAAISPIIAGEWRELQAIVKDAPGDFIPQKVQLILSRLSELGAACKRKDEALRAFKPDLAAVRIPDDQANSIAALLEAIKGNEKTFNWLVACAREAARRPMEAALRQLYEETADYIRVNNLGDVHHNKSMQDARAALSLPAEGKR